MSRFKNTAGRALRVELGDVAYALREGGVVEIPARLDYVVAARGLKLAPTTEPEAGVTRENLLPPPAGVAELPEGDRAGFLDAWRKAVSQGDRNHLFESLVKHLRALAEESAEEPDEEPEGESPQGDDEPAEEAPEAEPAAPEADDIDAQITAAAKASGRARRTRAKE